MPVHKKATPKKPVSKKATPDKKLAPKKVSARNTHRGRTGY